ncbi:MAG: DmsE family decaheme c-type cytochrome [Alphaproteobacteria bacterium]|nr:DmsE family decaheme c-type cytochrome [Alphaproteobacteria bacterium]
MKAKNILLTAVLAVLFCPVAAGAAGVQKKAEPVPAASSPSSLQQSEPIYAERGAETCMKCHDDTYKTKKGNKLLDILKSPHAVKSDGRTPFGPDNHDCETCHGASPQHIHSRPAPGQKRTEPTIVFNGPNASPVAARNKMCLSCHQDTDHMDWQGSQHQSNNIACTDCHTVHVKKDPILVKKTQPEVCFTCHAEQRALTLQYSHHPIREGKVACSDCHNPHGSPGPHMLKKVRVTDLCYTCHADKRGPMLWEHQPVREDCTNCHNPHGSVNPRLLKEKVPFLCFDCHAATNDMGGVGVSAHSVAPGSSSFYLYGDRSCLSCHSQIHGSNSPSGSTFFR